MIRRHSGYIAGKGGKKTLPTFNIRIGEKLTSIRLSPILDIALVRIARLEDCGVDDLCSYIDQGNRRRQVNGNQGVRYQVFHGRRHRSRAPQSGAREADSGSETAAGRSEEVPLEGLSARIQ